ncbi:MAG: hypothetical protein AAF211_23065 [Myxococcota bacterium]
MVKLMLCVVAWAFTMPAWAGVVFEVEVKDHSGAKPATEAMQAVVEGRRLKMASSKAPDRALMAFDGTKRQMTVFDHDARTYTVLDEAALKQTMQGVSSALQGAVNEAMAELSPAERAQLEAMMKNNPALAGRIPGMAPAPPSAKPKRELKRVGTRASHGGYPCVRYDLFEDGVRTQELWVTDWSNLKGASEVRAVFEDLTSFFAGLVEALPSMGPMSGALPMDDELAMMKDLKGFPVFAREFGRDGSLESETTLRSSKTQAVPASAFGPPAGYRRQEMPSMMP